MAYFKVGIFFFLPFLPGWKEKEYTDFKIANIKSLPGFDPRILHVKIMVQNIALGKISLPFLIFSPVSTSHTSQSPVIEDILS